MAGSWLSPGTAAFGTSPREPIECGGRFDKASNTDGDSLTTPQSSSPRNLTLWALIALILFWGANFSVVKFALRDMAPLAFTTLRFLLASGVLWLFLKVGGDRVRINRLHWLAMIGLGVVGTTVYQVFFIYGIDWTLAGNASLILATTPVFTTLLSLFFRQERSSLTVVVGIGLSVLGIALVVLGGSKGVSFGAGTLRGDLAVLVAAAAWSAYTVGSVPLVHRYGVVPVTAVTMWVGTLGLLIVSLPALLAQDWAAVRPVSWLAVLYSGIFAIATAYFLWCYCIRQIGSTRTAVYTNFTPVVALLIAWLTLGEVPTPLQAAGAGGIIVGSVLVRAGKIERPRLGR
jgi:drug/metabolite transporter (DMT)-like permease